MENNARVVPQKVIVDVLSSNRPNQNIASFRVAGD
jgi:hypothetical protein